ncbi:MAG: hypothetical protein MRY79_05470 [Alphaproteobacteria bacterium]|nr:hypothetical protein [Alphaproteobacteria bacterium]
MQNLPPDLQFLNKLIFPLLPQINKASLLRIVIWTFAFLILFHFTLPKVPVHLPYQNAMTEQNLTPIATSTNDLRWSRLDQQQLPENSILWISGSSHAIHTPQTNKFTFLPSLVAPQLNGEYSHALNLKMATRAMDNYTAILDGIKRKPAAMIVVLNPFWTLNERALFFKTNLMNRGLDYWTNIKDWPLIPLSISPGNLLWHAVGRHYAPTANSYDILKHLKKSGAISPARKAKKHKKKKSRISYNQSAMFWIINREFKDQEFKKFGVNDWQNTVMAFNDLKYNRWSEHLLRRSFEAITKSHIPTFIYVAPVNPALENQMSYPHYQEVINRISQIASEYKSDHLRVVTHIPANIIRSMTFKDYLHLTNSGEFDEYLVKEINTLLGAQKK